MARRGKVVQMGVTDDGEGMTADVRKHALDPFFTTKKRGLGTGLGLSLVRGVAQSAGGSVEIESDVGKGTTVVLNLPTASSLGRRAGKKANPEHVAAITIRDRRGATFCLGPLAGGSFQCADDGGHAVRFEPVVDCRAGSHHDRRRRTVSSSRPRARVIAFGQPVEDWSRLGAYVIDDPSNLDTIRRTLGDAVAATVSTA